MGRNAPVIFAPAEGGPRRTQAQTALAGNRVRTPGGTARGLTLVELVVALSILTVMLLCVGGMTLALSRQVMLNREYATADEVANSVLSDIHTRPFTLLQDADTGYPDGKTIPIPELENGQIVVDYEDPAADPLMITVTISWDTMPQGTVSRVFRTIRTR